MPAIPKAAYSIYEVCREVGICRSTFYTLIKSGKGPKILKIGGSVRVTSAALDAWLRELQAAGSGMTTRGSKN